MKRKVDYKKAWGKLRRWLFNAHDVSDYEMYEKMTEILKQCTKQIKDEEPKLTKYVPPHLRFHKRDGLPLVKSKGKPINLREGK